jgi:hypothetical protein
LTERASIRRAPGSFPLLDAASGGVASFKGEIAQTRDKIDPSGDVVDHASPEQATRRRPMAPMEFGGSWRMWSRSCARGSGRSRSGHR